MAAIESGNRASALCYRAETPPNGYALVPVYPIVNGVDLHQGQNTAVWGFFLFAKRGGATGVNPGLGNGITDNGGVGLRRKGLHLPVLMGDNTRPCQTQLS